ncbi:hypothetical protein SDC9_202551 [bioreactor metagenome]|uniref:Uncharacterized protein n=1 Tax=bioreactor metagenome TaxID=1076179 RepID=A0A645J5X7_9ZZZZ
MARYASPIAEVPVAHAVQTAIHAPLAPKRIAKLPAAMLAIILEINIEETFFIPLSIRSLCSVHKVLNPPIPEPKYTASRSGAIAPTNLLSSMASSPAYKAYCTNKSVFRKTALSMRLRGSKFLISAASLNLLSVVS